MLLDCNEPWAEDQAFKSCRPWVPRRLRSPLCWRGQCLRLTGRHLPEELRSNRDFAGERVAIGGDQEDRKGNARGKQRECDAAGGTVVAVHQGNGDQRAERLEQQAGPFDRGQRRLADDDALAACLHCRLQCTDDLALRRPLPFVGGRYGKRGLHRLDQRRWQRRERCALHSHCWPFLMDRVVDVLGHEGANPRPLLGGRSSASRLTVRRALASLATATFAFSKSLHTCAAMKPTSRPKMMPSGGSMPGERALKAFARSPTASLMTVQSISAA